MNVFNRVIGGSGGETASIFVTGLSQSDTVTALTPSGNTLNGVWTTKEVTVITKINPTMTSATTPSGVASSLNRQSSDLDGWHAFDGLISQTTDIVMTGWVSLYGVFPTWVQYEFESSKIISGVKIWPACDEYRHFAQTKGNIQVSDDGNTWETVTTFESNLTYKVPLDAFDVEFGEAVETKYIRFNFTQANETYSSGRVFIGEIEIYGLEEQTVSGFLLSNLKKYGTYTVTATDGVKTTTETVLVDAATEYEIEMGYILKLYWLGDECEDVTGGWAVQNLTTNYSNKGILTKNDTSMTFSGVATSFSGIVTANQIQKSGYTKLCVEITSAGFMMLCQPTYPQALNTAVLYRIHDTTTPDNGTIKETLTDNDLYPAIAESGVRTFTVSKIWLE